MIPTNGIVPIVKILNGDLHSFLGTGFLIGDGRKIITAKHVLEMSPREDGEFYGIAYLMPDKTVLITELTGYLLSNDFDIAILDINQRPPNSVTFSISSNKVDCDLDVLTVEYSSTHKKLNPDGGHKIHFNPNCHKGNVLCHYISDYPEKIPTPSFDTSFPALQGASGAPVVRMHDQVVVGMIVANRERHLIPAQVVKIKEDDEVIEETSYFLPLGKAIEGEVIIDFLRSQNIKAAFVD